MSATIDINEAIGRIVREVQQLMTVGTQYTRDHIVLPLRNWVIIMHQSFAINHREAELVLDVDPLVVSMRSLVTIMNVSYSQLDVRQSLANNQPEAELLLDMDPLVQRMRSLLSIINDSYCNLDRQSSLGIINHREAETLIEVDSLLLPMQSLRNIMSDSTPELYVEQQQVIDPNVAILITQCIYRLARSTYDIMSVLTG